MKQRTIRMLTAVLLYVLVCGAFAPLDHGTADSGGPEDTGDHRGDGLRIYNNSSSHWKLSGNDRKFNDSYVEVDGNITMENSSNLTLIDSVMNVTGLFEINNRSKLELVNSTLNMWGNVNLTTNSTVILRNSTLAFMPSMNGQYGLYAHVNSSLYVLDRDDNRSTESDASVIESGTASAYLMIVNHTRDLLIRNSAVRDCGYYAPIFPLGRSGLFIQSDNTTVTGSVFENGHTGLLYYNSRGAKIRNNVFRSENGVLLVNTHDSKIENNSFIGERNDILVQIGKRVLIANNSITSGYPSGDENNTGIELWYVQNSTVVNNSVRGKSADGIAVAFSAKNNVSANEISECQKGFNVTRLSNRNIIGWNNITDVDTGIRINNSKLNRIVRNGIEDVNATGVDAFDNREQEYANNSINSGKLGFSHDNVTKLQLHNNTVSNVSGKGVFGRAIERGEVMNNSFDSCSEEALELGRSSELTVAGNYLDGEEARISNSTVSEISVTTGDTELLNSTVGTIKAAGNSTLTRSWHLNVKVVNALGIPVPGARVTVRNATGSVVANRTTIDNGSVMWLKMREYVIVDASSNRIFKTPHTVTVAYGEYETNISQNINRSLTKTLRLNLTDILTDWTIEGWTTIRDGTVDLWGNLTVPIGSRLSLFNLSLVIHGDGGERSITVETGGELYMYGNETRLSNLTSHSSDGQHNFLFRVESGALLQLDHVRVSGCGLQLPRTDYPGNLDKLGLFIESDNVLISDSEFEGNHIGAVFNNTVRKDRPVIRSTHFKDGYGGVFVTDSDIRIEDSSVINQSGFGIVSVMGVSRTSVTLDGQLISDTRGFGVFASGSNLEMKDAELLRINGTGIKAENVTAALEGCRLSGNGLGLFATNASSLEISNSSIRNSDTKDLWVDNASSVRLVNTIPVKYHIPEGDPAVIRDTYLVTFRSMDGHSYRIANTDIELEEYVENNETPNSKSSFTTDEGGEKANVPVTHWEIRWWGILDYRYNITATKGGFSTGRNTSVVFTNQTREWIVVLNDIEPPAADAGQDAWINEGSTHEFDGSGSGDNTEIVSYAWSFNDSGNLVRLRGVHPWYKFDTPGIYDVTLRVRDRNGNTDSDTVRVTVSMLPFDDTHYVSEGGVSAKVYFTNRGTLPELNISILGDPGLSKPAGLDSIGIFFKMEVAGISRDDWELVEIGVRYGDAAVERILDEKELDLYIGEKERWTRANPFTRVYPEDDRLVCNITSVGTFTVLGPIDITAPYVLTNQVYPGPGTAEIPLDTEIDVVFNEEVTGVDDGSLLLLNPRNKMVPASVASRGAEATLTPDNDLEPGSRYTVLAKTDIRDLYGNPLKDNITWSFTTISVKRTFEVLATYPEDGQRNVGVNITVGIVFSEAVALGNALEYVGITPKTAFSADLLNGNRTLILTPLSDLEYSSNYSVKIPKNLTSVPGRSLDREYVINFTTEGEPRAAEKGDEEEEGLDLDLRTASYLTLILVIAIFLALMYLTYRKHHFKPPAREITEEIGGDYCPSCGEEVGPLDNICSACGARIGRKKFKTACPKCDTPMEAGDKKCPSCGFKPKAKELVGKKDVEDEEPRCPFCHAEVDILEGACPECGEVFFTEGGMAMCENCGASVERDEMFCPYCGDELYEREMVCSECGASITTDDAVCPECGEIFDEDVVLELEDEDELTESDAGNELAELEADDEIVELDADDEIVELEVIEE